MSEKIKKTASNWDSYGEKPVGCTKNFTSIDI